METEKILDTAPIYRTYFPMQNFMNFILCFTEKRVIFYFFDYWPYKYAPPTKYFKEMEEKEKELKAYEGNIDKLINSKDNSFEIPYEDFKKIRFVSEYRVYIKLNENHKSRRIALAYIINNQTLVKKLFKKYCASVFKK